MVYSWQPVTVSKVSPVTVLACCHTLVACPERTYMQTCTHTRIHTNKAYLVWSWINHPNPQRLYTVLRKWRRSKCLLVEMFWGFFLHIIEIIKMFDSHLKRNVLSHICHIYYFQCFCFLNTMQAGSLLRIGVCSNHCVVVIGTCERPILSSWRFH